jgi:hypothetical protein
MAALAGILFLAFCAPAAGEMLLDHEVVIDDAGRLQPWTSWDRILAGSMEYLIHCPEEKTRHGMDPWFLITSKLNEDGSFLRNQNNQGSNAYYAVETLRRWLARGGDRAAITPVRKLLARVRHYHTPADWAWPAVPRTQDNTPDGVYTDLVSGADKICMAGTACLRFAAITGEKKYISAAEGIAETVMPHISEGSADRSPLPFRVNLRSGAVLDPYTAGMVFCAEFFEELADLKTRKRKRYLGCRDRLWNWVLAYPVRNGKWAGYYEDVGTDHENLNQQVALETARYMLNHYEESPAYREHIPAIIAWVRGRFGQTRRFGAVSIREQDTCFKEMSSHTARYASVVAGWYARCEKDGLRDAETRAALREEARACLALCSYSTFSRHSEKGRALNYVGAGYLNPWFSDSYFDFLPHVMDTLDMLSSYP